MEPPAPVEGRAYATENIAQIPADWGQAVDAFEAGPIRRRDLRSRASLHLIACKRQEIAGFAERSRITNSAPIWNRMMARKQKSYAGDGTTRRAITPPRATSSAIRSAGRPDRNDICIVRAGYSGPVHGHSSCRKGLQGPVVEGAQVGWGASGRNGGQIVNGLNAGLSTIERRYASDAARFIGGLVQEGDGSSAGSSASIDRVAI